jgi:hypothetical protein
MKKIVLTIMSVASLSLCINANAKEKDYYAGGNVGMANLSSQVGSNFTINGFFGHDFNKYIGIEGDFTYFMSGDYTSSAWSSGVKNPTGQISQYFLGGALKANLPLTNKLGLYGKAGLGYTYASLTPVAGGSAIGFDNYNGQSSAWFPTTLLGAGIKYDLTNNLDIHFEDMNYISATGGNLLAVGMSFSF